MFGFFEKTKDSSRPSIGEVIRGDKKKTAEETRKMIFDALTQIETQKNLYATTAQRAINKAKAAIANHDAAGKQIAYNELKFAYGVYQYMSTLLNAFRTIKSQMDMQEMTESFATVVNNLSKIRVSSNNVNFDKLTANALRGFETIDMSGLDKMVQQLIEGSIQATNTSGATDSFLDKLISGEASLDTPYDMASKPSDEKTHSENTQTAAAQSDEGKKTEDLLAMLDAINAGLNKT